MHDDGGSGHAHAHHTADGQVGTGQHDQTSHAQSQEHTGRGHLEDVQHVVHSQQLHALDSGSDEAQSDEDDQNGYIQAVLQQEVPGVEGVAVVLHLLGQGLTHGELGHAQQIDEVELVLIGGMTAILDLLKVLIQGHLGVKEAVFVDVLLVLDLVGIGELGQGLLVLLVQLSHGGTILLLGEGLLLFATGGHVLEVVLVEVGLQIGFGVGNQLGHLSLVLGLHSLGLLQLLAPTLSDGLLLLFGVDAVPL